MISADPHFILYLNDIIEQRRMYTRIQYFNGMYVLILIVVHVKM